MTKTLSIRLDDHIAALVAEQAEQEGISMNRAIQDAIVRDAARAADEAMVFAKQAMEDYPIVMERLGS